MSKQEELKYNLLYFESPSMRELYQSMKNWQDANQRRFLLLNIQQDSGNFCCIALINAEQPLTKYVEAMAKFQRKALRHIGVSVSFEDPAIPPEKLLRIQFNLEKCTTPTEVKELFRGEF